ncbi:hypothetical protein, partial [Marinitenerispora sediminis]|uniref:hypothetical protein n=1 Tax=Marinitenerispora sediminis TaxID=1931232 RepID=UPI000E04E99D
EAAGDELRPAEDVQRAAPGRERGIRPLAEFAPPVEETRAEADRLRAEFERIARREEARRGELRERTDAALAARRRTLDVLGRAELVTCGL